MEPNRNSISVCWGSFLANTFSYTLHCIDAHIVRYHSSKLTVPQGTIQVLTNPLLMLSQHFIVSRTCWYFTVCQCFRTVVPVSDCHLMPNSSFRDHFPPFFLLHFHTFPFLSLLSVLNRISTPDINRFRPSLFLALIFSNPFWVVLIFSKPFNVNFVGPFFEYC